MKTIAKIQLTTLCFLLLTFNALAQKPVRLNWQTNFEAISKQARIEKKPVLLFFHGSDWCPGCIQMSNEVFKTADFIDFASKKVLFLDVDFPIHTKLPAKQLEQNTNLKKKFLLPSDPTQGYPQVVIIDAKGKILYQEKGYRGEGPKKLMNIIKGTL